MKSEYIQWYRIAQAHVKDKELLPDLNDSEIIKNVSKNNWFMFANAYNQEKKSAINLPEPNIYLVVEENTITLGIAFNNIAAVEKLKNILADKSSAERELLVKKLLSLDDSYVTIVERRIRKYYGPRPDFELEKEMQTNKLDNNKFEEIIRLCIKIREEGKEHKKLAEHKSFFECPAINLVAIDINKDVEKFKSALDDIIPIYKICLGIKTDKELKDSDLIDKIKQIDPHLLDLEFERKKLSNDLKRKFNLEISVQKLKKLADKLDQKDSKILEQTENKKNSLNK